MPLAVAHLAEVHEERPHDAVLAQVAELAAGDRRLRQRQGQRVVVAGDAELRGLPGDSPELWNIAPDRPSISSWRHTDEPRSAPGLNRVIAAAGVGADDRHPVGAGDDPLDPGPLLGGLPQAHLLQAHGEQRGHHHEGAAEDEELDEQHRPVRRPVEPRRRRLERPEPLQGQRGGQEGDA